MKRRPIPNPELALLLEHMDECRESLAKQTEEFRKVNDGLAIHLGFRPWPSSK